MATKKAEALITSTIEALDGGAQNVKPKDGVSLIEDWITALKKEDKTSDVADQLQALHDQLAEKTPDGKKIHTVLKKLADGTAKAAKDANGDLKDSLKDLADSLKEFTKDLN